MENNIRVGLITGITGQDGSYLCELFQSSICAITWFVNEALMTKLGWPVAHPRLTSLPSANKIIIAFKKKSDKFILWDCLQNYLWQQW